MMKILDATRFLVLSLAVTSSLSCFLYAPRPKYKQMPTYRGAYLGCGYFDWQSGDNTYFVGYSVCESEARGLRAVDALLYRCAELTVEKGFDYFMLLETGQELQEWVDSQIPRSGFTWNTEYTGNHPVARGVLIDCSNRICAVLISAIKKEDIVESDPSMYDARLAMQRLEERVRVRKK